VCERRFLGAHFGPSLGQLFHASASCGPPNKQSVVAALSHQTHSQGCHQTQRAAAHSPCLPFSLLPVALPNSPANFSNKFASENLGLAQSPNSQAFVHFWARLLAGARLQVCTSASLQVCGRPATLERFFSRLRSGLKGSHKAQGPAARGTLNMAVRAPHSLLSAGALFCFCFCCCFCFGYQCGAVFWPHFGAEFAHNKQQ